MFKAGDIIKYKKKYCGGLIREEERGVVTRVDEDMKVWARWNGDITELWVPAHKAELDSKQFTREQLEEILLDPEMVALFSAARDSWYVSEQGAWCSLVGDFLDNKFQPPIDPEYAEYLRLKEKFEK